MTSLKSNDLDYPRTVHNSLLVLGSLELLCSAHDYLGPLGLCTVEAGQMLRLLVDKITECLPKVKGQRLLVEHLTKNMDQVTI